MFRDLVRSHDVVVEPYREVVIKSPVERVRTKGKTTRNWRKLLFSDVAEIENENERKKAKQKALKACSK